MSERKAKNKIFSIIAPYLFRNLYLKSENPDKIDIKDIFRQKLQILQMSGVMKKDIFLYYIVYFWHVSLLVFHVAINRINDIKSPVRLNLKQK